MGLSVCYSVFNDYWKTNRLGAVTTLVKPNLRWLVRRYDGYSRTFDLPVLLDWLLVMATSLTIAFLYQIYKWVIMHPASPIEGHSLQ